jgi:hypothetical protein
VLDGVAYRQRNVLVDSFAVTDEEMLRLEGEQLPRRRQP